MARAASGERAKGRSARTKAEKPTVELAAGAVAALDGEAIEAVRTSYISQIEAEDMLVGLRMGWMLQFNGFLIASYGLALKEGQTVPLIQNFLASVPFIGLAVSVLSLLGIWAALSAANAKQREWQGWMAVQKPGEASKAARPLFLSSRVAWYGSAANGFGLPLVVTGFWLWMLYSSLP